MTKTAKILIALAFVLVLVGLWFVSGVFRELSDVPSVHSPVARLSTPRAEKKKRYLTGQEETVTFFARESDNSDRMIARKAFIMRRPGAKLTVFAFHGFMCNKNDIRFLTNALFGENLDSMPINTITIDFRAHGDIPEGQCCSFGYNEKHDVKGIVEFAKNDPELSKTRRIAYGFSMGAVASILAQSEDPSLFEMAIWDCPFESTENVIGRAIEQLRLSILGYEMPMPGRSILQKYAYNSYVQSMLKFALKTIAKMDMRQVDTCILPVNTVDAMSKITIPLMLIGCRNDEKAPVSALKALYDVAGGYKRLWITNGRNHFDSYFYNPEKYIYKVRRFIQKVLDGTIKYRYQAYISEDAPQDGA